MAGSAGRAGGGDAWGRLAEVDFALECSFADLPPGAGENVRGGGAAGAAGLGGALGAAAALPSGLAALGNPAAQSFSQGSGGVFVPRAVAAAPPLGGAEGLCAVAGAGGALRRDFSPAQSRAPLWAHPSRPDLAARGAFAYQYRCLCHLRAARHGRHRARPAGSVEFGHEGRELAARPEARPGSAGLKDPQVSLDRAGFGIRSAKKPAPSP